MAPRSILSASLLGTVMVGGALLASTACSNAGAQEPWTTWRTLRMKAHAVPLFSGSMEMQLSEEAGKSTLETRTIARFLGIRIARSWTRTVIDPSSGRTESYVMSTPKRGRRYRFGETGYTVEKLKPTHGPDAPLDRWEITSSQAFAYPLRDDGGTVAVFDYYGMLLQLARMPLNEPGDEVVLHVATPGGPVAYRIRVGEAESTAWTYQDLSSQARRTLDIRKLRLRIIPADPDNADEGFMKMEGETELWVEAGSKTLLSLGGKVPKVPGRVELVLAALG